MSSTSVHHPARRGRTDETSPPPRKAVECAAQIIIRPGAAGLLHRRDTAVKGEHHPAQRPDFSTAEYTAVEGAAQARRSWGCSRDTPPRLPTSTGDCWTWGCANIRHLVSAQRQLSRSYSGWPPGGRSAAAPLPAQWAAAHVPHKAIWGIHGGASAKPPCIYFPAHAV